MTQLVTVQTDFRDLEQMAQGLAGRVHATHVILPAGESVDEGAWAQFEIALQDGSAGLAGLGRCVTVVDNGDERLPHQRFDVVFDSLQFETHEQRIFEHILALHGVGGRELEQLADGDAESLPPTVAETTGSYVDVSTDFTGSQADAAAAEAEAEVEAAEAEAEESEDNDQTMVASAEELETMVTDYQSAPPAPGGEANDVTPPVPAAAYTNGAYGRGATAHAVQHAVQVQSSPSAHEEAFEEPLSGERIAPVRPVNGTVFAYTSGIPFPAKPPRPELEPSLRVTPAPRPTRA